MSNHERAAFGAECRAGCDDVGQRVPQPLHLRRDLEDRATVLVVLRLLAAGPYGLPFEHHPRVAAVVLQKTLHRLLSGRELLHLVAFLIKRP